MRRTTPALILVVLALSTAVAFQPSRPSGAGSGTLAWSDTFSSLSSAWHEVDPLGDGKVSVSGGALNLAIPSGVDALRRDHNNWPNQSPVNRTLRVVRPVAGTSWTYTTRILNTDKNAGKFAGVLVESSPGHFFRSDWDGDGEKVRLYVGTYDGGSAFVKRYDKDTGSAKAQWQRITKSGSSYTVATSLDGSKWTSRVTFSWSPSPTVVGLNVGNSGKSTAPAYTAQFDHATLTVP